MTNANYMSVVYGTYLLTYNPSCQTCILNFMDYDEHDSGNNSNGFEAYPLQQLVPYGQVAIPMVAFQQGSSNPLGLAGCVAGQTDTGGLASFLVSGTCVSQVSISMGVYMQANSACGVSTVPIGPCVIFVNLTGAAYNSNLCGAIGTLGTDLGLIWNNTTQHQATYGTLNNNNGPESNDTVNGGTLGTSAAFNCMAPNIPSDSAIFPTT
jgi:hypothetical protein